MAVNYNDARFTQVEDDKKQALTENEQLYNDMIGQSNEQYKSLVAETKNWGEKQAQLQNEQTDFAIKQIEQQKQQAEKDYIKEQSGAYVDWQKQSNKYGANAEQAASQGLANTGYSESSQVNMYVTYQNRVATARESYNNAILNYNNSMTEARLQNNATLAQIAHDTLQQQLELTLEGLQYNNTLLLDKAEKKLTIDEMYHNRYKDVLSQINTENALAEEIRQYNETMAYQKAKDKQEQENWQKEYNLSVQQLKNSGSGGGSSGGTVKSSSTVSAATKQKIIDNLSGKKTSTTSSSSSQKKYPINYESLYAAGLANVSASDLNKLVQSGVVEEYVKDGKMCFRMTGKKSSLLNASNLPKSVSKKLGLG